MSYQFYKVIHVLSIVFFFSMYMSAVRKSKDTIKKEVILTGVALALILISGMGLIKYIGISHGGPWPLWLKFKVGIWAFVGMFGHIALKRYFSKTTIAFWILFVVLGCASILANYKPF